MKLTDLQRDATLAMADERGCIKPDDVIAAAREPDHPLHGKFQWDVRKAALRDWRRTANHIIEAVEIRTVTETRTIVAPYFTRDPSVAGNEQGSRAITELAKDDDLARAVMVREYRRVRQALDRARAIAITLGLGREHDAIAAEITALLQRADYTTESAGMH